MLNKQKEWCQTKMEKGKEFLKEHKIQIGFVGGVVFTTVAGMLIDKLLAPKQGCIRFLDDDYGAYAEVWTKDRFENEHKLFDVLYSKEDGDLDKLVKQINEIQHPED